MVHRLDQFRPVAYILFDGRNELFDQDLVVRRAPQLFGFNNQFFEMQNRLHEYHLLAGGPAGRVSEPPGLPSPSSDESTYLRTLRTAYVTNISRMHSFAAARGARLLVVFQPELGNKRFRTEQEQMTLEALYTAHKDLDRQFPAKYAVMGREATGYCQAAGIQYLDPFDAIAGLAGPTCLDFEAIIVRAPGRLDSFRQVRAGWCMLALESMT